MSPEFWNERYKSDEYAYGEEPNEFFRRILDTLPPGKILLPQEGEGRNAVYAARKGWECHAFDISVEGMRKAVNLARKYAVSIHYTLGGYADFQYEDASMDVVAFIFAHVTPEVRESYYHKILKTLKPGGRVILEGFHKDQLGRTSGGPQSLELLYSKEELKADFRILHDKSIHRSDRVLDEGPYHQGEAALIQMTGIKR
ncbi:MAG: class I SAM-dependent methyltransferase [Cyclobacteriaceae bacterium]|nr:class I SAM-dependent methyltransferase [Cyclobacteriaceae bacterium]